MKIKRFKDDGKIYIYHKRIGAWVRPLRYWRYTRLGFIYTQGGLRGLYKQGITKGYMK